MGEDVHPLLVMPPGLPDFLKEAWCVYPARNGGAPLCGVWIEKGVDQHGWFVLQGFNDSDLGDFAVWPGYEVEQWPTFTPEKVAEHFIEPGEVTPTPPPTPITIPEAQQRHPSGSRNGLRVVGGTEVPVTYLGAAESPTDGGFTGDDPAMLAAANYIANELVHDGIGYEGCDCPDDDCPRSRLVRFVDMALDLDDPEGVLDWLRDNW